MTQPQIAIFNEQSQSYHHLEYTFKDDVYLADIHSALKTALNKQSDDVHVVVAFGRSATNTLLPDLQLDRLLTLLRSRAHTEKKPSPPKAT